jgi:hypothetical protein
MTAGSLEDLTDFIRQALTKCKETGMEPPFIVSGVLPPSCGGRRSSEDANGVDRIGSHIWSTI